MSSLIEQARLTDEEIQAVEDMDCVGDLVSYYFDRTLADAATAKALWAVTEWLDGAMAAGFTPLGAVLTIRGALESADTRRRHREHRPELL